MYPVEKATAYGTAIKRENHYGEVSREPSYTRCEAASENLRRPA